MKRVVVTGIGVVAPNGNNKDSFLHSLRNGISGIKHFDELEKLNFRCQSAGVPNIDITILEDYFSKGTMKSLKSTAVIYGAISAIEAYKDASLEINPSVTDWDTGCVFGCSAADHLLIKEAINYVDSGSPKSMGSRYVAQTMASGPSAYINQLFGLGNHVFSNSSACSTGTESILLAYEKIKNGSAKRMVAGSCESSSMYTWASFDAMRVLSSLFPDAAEKASRPMSKTAAGFVPGSGAATLILEEYETAKKRGAKIYAEVLGGALNSGGQRNGGSLTAPNNVGIQRCVKEALNNASITANQVDLISGHLTATMADTIEIDNWTKALNRRGSDFPYINSLKSMTGHCLSAAGSIESVSAILQLKNGFVFGNKNCEDLHPSITECIDESRIPMKSFDKELNIVVKANFGFGDVNSCIIFKKKDS